MTTIKQYDIWIADLEPQRGTESGKVRPVLVIQTDHLNRIHPSVIICPITTIVQRESDILRVHLSKGKFGIKEDCDIMIDQIRAIDNRRLIKRVGQILGDLIEKVQENIKIVLNIE
jgi:mRNA interferase MazF